MSKLKFARRIHFVISICNEHAVRTLQYLDSEVFATEKCAFWKTTPSTYYTFPAESNGREWFPIQLRKFATTKNTIGLGGKKNNKNYVMKLNFDLSFLAFRFWQIELIQSVVRNKNQFSEGLTSNSIQ